MDTPANQVPKEVTELQTFLNDINRQRSALLKGTFPGNAVADIAKLETFLQVSYKQVLNQLEEHPFVVAGRKKLEEAAAQAAKDAEALKVEQQAADIDSVS